MHLPQPIKRPYGHAEPGFTLLELMLVLAITALLLQLAGPSFGRLLAQQQLRSVSNELLYSLRQTRSLAIRTGSRVSLCPVSDSGDQCSDTNQWQQGWQIFVDTNANGALDNGEQLLRRNRQTDTNLQISGNRFVSQYVSYSPSGDSRRAQGRRTRGSLQLGTLTVCSTHAELANTGYAVVISRGGRPRLQPVSC